MGRGANYEHYQRARRGYRAAFQNALGPMPSIMQLFAYQVPDDQADAVEEHFPTLKSARVPKLRGMREYTDIVWHNFETTSAVRALGFVVPRRDMRTDRWEHYMTTAGELGQIARYEQHRELVSYLVNGFNGSKGLAHDGQFFFDAEHQTNTGTTWSNSHDLALTADNFDVVYSALRRARWPDGRYVMRQQEPANAEEPLVKLVIGPDLQTSAEQIVNETTEGGGSNVRRKRATVVVLDDLNEDDDEFGFAANYWFLVATGSPELKALSYREPEPIELVERTQPEDAENFKDDQVRFGVRGEWGFGYRAPWTIQGSKGGA